jgi:hypothetical protein
MNDPRSATSVSLATTGDRATSSSDISSRSNSEIRLVLYEEESNCLEPFRACRPLHASKRRFAPTLTLGVRAALFATKDKRLFMEQAALPQAIRFSSVKRVQPACADLLNYAPSLEFAR